MDKEKTNDSPKASPEEADSREEILSESEAPEDQKQKEEKKGSIKKYLLAPIQLPVRFLLGHKWIALSTVGALLLMAGVLVIIGEGWLNFETEKPPAVILGEMSRDDLQEEALAPLFIPFSKDESNRLLMVDFSIIWDGLSSIRFKKRELQIRNHLYERVIRLAAKKNDLDKDSVYLEKVMSRVFRESLGREDLTVRIKKLTTY